MKFSREQRINNIGAGLVVQLTQMCEQARDLMTKGVDVKAGDPPGYPPLTATAEEFKKSLGDNAKRIETVISFVLDGKSNQVSKATKKPKGK